ncbi:hypothetical protein [Kitasatospora sp. NPDC056181]|uniref:hypothetical protein n=1 Tax=Kitasatospora sp. NPDC056181 TaxID=3345737 RepID=UPI0035DF609F
MTKGTDPRATRITAARQQAVVELAPQWPVSQVTVAELAERAGTTRATFYNRYSTPLAPRIEALYADLETGHRLEDRRRAEGAPGASCYGCPWWRWLITSSASPTSTATRPTAEISRSDRHGGGQ